MGTAGFDLSWVNGKSLAPLPPPRITARMSSRLAILNSFFGKNHQCCVVPISEFACLRHYQFTLNNNILKNKETVY
jgi:hypothetical protein